MTDWSAKTPLQWDWENTIMFNARATEYSKSTNWEIDVDTGPIYSSGVGCAGGLDLGHVTSSSKSSVDSSSIEKSSNFHFEDFEEFPVHFCIKKEPGNVNQTGSSVTLETLMGNGEPFTGLKLGKRTYFEDFCIGNKGKASHNSVNIITSSTPTEKRLSCPRIRCQVEGCNLDLSAAKEYHRKHKVCEIHSKFPKVVVKGLERRFCQQCSRFQNLSDFDEEKRSCRKRLSHHNSRRRKPKNKAILFNSARLGSILSGADGGQQMDFNKFPFVHSSSVANLSLESMGNPKFTLMNESPLRPKKPKGSDGKLSSEPPNVSTFYHDSKWPLSKGGTAEILNKDLEESMISSNSDAAHDVNRALSLLSTTSWDLCEPEAAPVNHRRDLTSTGLPHSLINTVSEGLPFSTLQNWWTEQSSESQMHSFNGHGNCHLTEFQLFNFPYGFEI